MIYLILFAALVTSPCKKKFSSTNVNKFCTNFSKRETAPILKDSLSTEFGLTIDQILKNPILRVSKYIISIHF